jgi:hypothetical protein
VVLLEQTVVRSFDYAMPVLRSSRSDQGRYSCICTGTPCRCGLPAVLIHGNVRPMFLTAWSYGPRSTLVYGGISVPIVFK